MALAASSAQLATNNSRERFAKRRRSEAARAPIHQLVSDHSAGIEQRRRNEELLNRMVDVARQIVALTDDARHAPVESLSDQERRILRLFAEGNNSMTIARRLRISPQTLRNHLHRINQKLRTHNRLEAVIHAQRRGLIE